MSRRASAAWMVDRTSLLLATRLGSRHSLYMGGDEAVCPFRACVFPSSTQHHPASERTGFKYTFAACEAAGQPCVWCGGGLAAEHQSLAETMNFSIVDSRSTARIASRACTSQNDNKCEPYDYVVNGAGTWEVSACGTDYFDCFEAMPSRHSMPQTRVVLGCAWNRIFFSKGRFPVTRPRGCGRWQPARQVRI